MNVAIQQVLDDAVNALERVLNGRGSIYLTGSFVDESANDLSDIDVVVIWAFEPQRAIAVEATRRSLRASSGDRLDVMVVPASDLASKKMAWLIPSLKLASRHLAGPDLRGQLRLPGSDEYAPLMLERALSRMRAFHRQEPSTGYVVAPDPSSPFLGFERCLTWYPPPILQGTKEMVALASLCAAAFVARAGDHVPGKRQAFELYERMGDEPFSSFAAHFYRRCRNDWGSAIPNTPDGREELQDYCGSLLAFENHLIDAVRD